MTCLAEDGAGALWIGHRRTGVERLDPATGHVAPLPPLPPADFVRAVLASDARTPGSAPTARGCSSPPPCRRGRAAPRAAAAGSRPGPGRRRADGAGAGRGEMATPLAPGTGAFLGDDWATQGDWVGRYGRQYAALCAMQGGGDHIYAEDLRYRSATASGRITRAMTASTPTSANCLPRSAAAVHACARAADATRRSTTAVGIRGPTGVLRGAGRVGHGDGAPDRPAPGQPVPGQQRRPRRRQPAARLHAWNCRPHKDLGRRLPGVSRPWRARASRTSTAACTRNFWCKGRARSTSRSGATTARVPSCKASSATA